MIDETFIKMHKALPKEVQDLIPEKRDTLWANKHTIYMNIDDDEIAVVDMSYDGFFDEEVEDFKLSRQEDLQEILKSVMKIDYPGITLFRIGEWANNPQKANKSYNMLWLCFVMEKCYNKEWDTEKEEWTRF